MIHDGGRHHSEELMHGGEGLDGGSHALGRHHCGACHIHGLGGDRVSGLECSNQMSQRHGAQRRMGSGPQ